MYLGRDEIQSRVEELGAEIAADYGGREPLLVAPLKSSLVFLADLSRALPILHHLDFVELAPYDASATQRPQPPGIRLLKDLDSDVHGRDVVIVEDIVDTGLTLNYLRRNLGARSPRSLRAVTLLDKSVRRIVPVPLEHRGFDIPDVFVVGYGLDFQALYRNVRDLLSVPDLPRLANDPRLLVSPLWPAS